MPGATDHISELLGTQGQPEIDDQGPDESLDGGSDLDGGGSEPPAVQQPVAEEPPAKGRPKKNVPLTALQEERARRQELQTQFEQERDRNNRLDQRVQQMLQLMQQQQQPQQPQQPQEQEVQIPSFVEDPEAHVNALRQNFERELAKLQQDQQQRQQASQQDQQQQQIAVVAARAEEEFKAVTPDYLQAADFFLKRKQAEYAAFGLDPVSLQQQVQRDYQGLVIASLQMGKNPAQVLYTMSKAMGYATPAPGAQPGQRQAPAARPVAPTSLSDIGGAPRAPDEEGELTADQLADMSDAEFDKFWNKMARQSRVSPKF